MKNILVGALLASVAFTSAFAADLPTRKSAPEPYIPPPPVFSWTGFYAGVNGSYDWGTLRHDYAGDFAHSPNGGFGGLTAGYNYQISQYVIGVEGDWAWGDMSKSRGFADGSSSSFKADQMATARARVGYAFDRALIYVTGGYAGLDTKGTFNDATLGATGTGTHWLNGYALGAGLEYAFTNNISAKAEYLFSQVGEKNYFTPGVDGTKAGLDISTIRVGVNYKFF